MGWFPCQCCEEVTSVTCSQCSAGEYPADGFLVKVRDVADGGSCAECVELNDDFIVDQTTGVVQGEGNACQLFYNLSPWTCAPFGGAEILVTVVLANIFTGERHVRVLIRSTAGMAATFQKSYFGLVDCTSFSDTDIPLISGGGGCDFTSATVSLTSL